MSEQDQWQSRRLTQRKKTETLGMDEPVEIDKTHGAAFTDPIPQSLETSIAHRPTPDLVLGSNDLDGVLEIAQEERPEVRAFCRHARQHTMPKTRGKTRSSNDCMFWSCGQSSKK